MDIDSTSLKDDNEPCDQQPDDGFKRELSEEPLHARDVITGTESRVTEPLTPWTLLHLFYNGVGNVD
jgi:hypothetical protein